MAPTKRHHGAERIVRGTLPSASAEMNVTPLIDVLLVLLIIFMAALPLTQQGLDADIPSVVAPSTTTVAGTHIVAEYTADHRFLINKREFDIGAAEGAFREIFLARRDKTLYVIGDPGASYGEIARLIDAAKGAGVDRVGIVTEGMRREAQAARER